ncbi:MAG TPA: prolyl oligopeptidase family serine peptidase [Patescibacteria group bacterium]|nr:prolyl oligopeptidase family serine peptidase [Patescibacteria group bacterium]
MKVKLLIISGFLLSFGIGFMVGQLILIKTQKPTQIVSQVVDRSLDKYTIDNLSNYWNTKTDPSTTLRVTSQLKDFPEFTSSEFIMNFNPSTSLGTVVQTKKTSGLINIPKGEGKYPLVIMIRGYVPTEQYFTGNGTINGSYFFAKNGFITVAPDFLGYGDSDKESSNVFESRFQTYTTVMAVLKSVGQIPNWDGKNIFIWAHSNGGQIALTTLEITGVNYPTVLWAPVSSSFPFDILYYSDEADDQGKSLRKELSTFEDVYNTDLYSLNNYLDKIKAPIQLDQGTADDSVPVDWSDNLADNLKKQGLPVVYNKYPGADHMMTPLWNTVIQKDLEYFTKNLKN